MSTLIDAATVVILGTVPQGGASPFSTVENWRIKALGDALREAIRSAEGASGPEAKPAPDGRGASRQDKQETSAQPEGVQPVAILVDANEGIAGARPCWIEFREPSLTKSFTRYTLYAQTTAQGAAAVEGSGSSGLHASGPSSTGSSNTVGAEAPPKGRA